MGVNQWRQMRWAIALVVGVAVLWTGRPALANDMDPVLARMWRYDPATNQIVTRDDLFDGLALDLARAMSPNVLYPAETLGWSGFFMGLEASLTVIDANATHWRCGIENASGSQYGGGNGECDSWEVADGAIFVPAVHVRKGLPYSIEIGFQIQYMANSELVAIGGEVRWAPFEGYRDGWAGYLPDVGLAFTGSYLMGSNELVLGQLGANASISYPFTVSGQATITPYFGYQFFIVGADQEQVFNSAYVNSPENFERDFQCDSGGTLGSCSPFLEFHDGQSRNFGQDLTRLKYHRIFLGARFLWENLAVTPQFAISLPWFSGEAAEETHFQFSLSVGSDF